MENVLELKVRCECEGTGYIPQADCGGDGVGVTSSAPFITLRMQSSRMKQRLIYFSGIAADLPLALLKHVNDELAEMNRKNARLLASPLHTISHLAAATRELGKTHRTYVQNSDGTTSVIYSSAHKQHIRSIILGI
jgi:hypothetical protein